MSGSPREGAGRGYEPPRGDPPGGYRSPGQRSGAPEPGYGHGYGQPVEPGYGRPPAEPGYRPPPGREYGRPAEPGYGPPPGQEYGRPGRDPRRYAPDDDRYDDRYGDPRREPEPRPVSGGPAGPVSGAPVSGGPFGDRPPRRGPAGPDRPDGHLDDPDEQTGSQARVDANGTADGLVPPARRLVSGGLAALAGLLSAALILGAQLERPAYAVVTFGVQALFVLAWTLSSRPPGPYVVAAVGIAAAAAADAAAVLAPEASLAPFALVVAGGLVAGVAGQLVRGAGRSRVTESFGSTLVVVIAVVALGSLVVLTRLAGGTQAIDACVAAAGVGLVVARLGDVFFPYPRVTPQVARGAIGVIVGGMVGTAVAGGAGALLVGLSPAATAGAGLVAGLGAVLADLGVGFADAGRRMAGEPPAGQLFGHLLAPLVGLAVAAPATYVLSVLVLVPGL